MLSLTPRLKQVARLVIPGNAIVDVGTDHAYIPIYLVQSGVISRAIATDIHQGPYNIAKNKVKAYRLEGKIEVRLGDGLKPVTPGEAQVAVIAGMGGLTIRDVLHRSPRVVQQLDQLVLQPMTAPDEVRKWLAQNGWRLAAEHLVKEEDKYYQIVSAVRGEQTWPSGENNLAWQLGPLLIDRGDELLAEYIEKLLSVNRNLLASLSRVNTAKGFARVEELKEEINELEELRERCRLNANK